MPEKHTHKFRRHTYETGGVIYFCVMPDCSVKIKPPLTLGKRSLCWRCGETFIMSEYSIKLAKPHCENCHKPKDKIKDEAKIESVAIRELASAVINDEPVSSMLNRMRGIPEEDGEI